MFICRGEKVIYNKAESIIAKVVDLDTVTIEEVETGTIRTVKIHTLKPYQKTSSKQVEISILTDKKWDLAQNRYNIIKPILEKKKKFKLVKELSQKHGISTATIYRWIKTFNEEKSVSSLAGIEKSGGRGKSRLNTEIENIIETSINETYLTASKKSINKTIRSIQQKCIDNKLKPPHPNTIRNRINNLSEELKLRKRYGNKEAKYKFEPHRGHFPGAEYPLSVVQIDHTPVDLILVDEQYRNPYKRPYLTIAIDVYSRVVLGFYLSFEAPSALDTGLCIAHAILPKELWLERIGIDAEWPCWGIMNTIHVDNAKEFRGKMLKNACINYGINIEWRPPATPHFGGHVERLLGTFSKEIHDIEGTTFSDLKKRKNYDSKAKSSLSLSELEQWLTLYITKIYHNKIHSSLEMSPLQKYKESVLGSENEIAVGIPERPQNERRLKLDFMPFHQRSIQEYGVVIDHIFYYDEVLRRYIHSKDKKNEKNKFIFKRDPRDISVIYFYDPELNDYFEVPYRNTSLPPISIWEYRDIVKTLRKNKAQINEEVIFKTYRELEELERNAIRKTKEYRKGAKKLKKEISISRDESKKTQINFETEEVIPFDEVDF